ncbi:MAG: hypothetical protein CL476_11510 [Acidobacteria bacterium]|nr:hypothetical protein [Acidobacteriota bacterium]
MVWFFTSAETYVRCETRYGPDGQGFELVISRSDGAETVERYADQQGLTDRWTRLETDMHRDGRAGPRPRDL